MRGGPLWLQLEVTLPRDPQLLQLARAAGIDEAHAVGLLACLWAAVKERGGQVERFTAADIEPLAGWRGEPGRLLGSAIATGWLQLEGVSADASAPSAPVSVSGADMSAPVSALRGWGRYEGTADASAAKRERDRKAQQRRREKLKKNKDRVSADTADIPADVSADAPADVSADTADVSALELELEPELEPELQDHMPAAGAAGAPGLPLEGVDTKSKREQDIDQVLTHYRDACGHPRARLTTTKARRQVSGRLKEGFTVAELCRALDALHGDDFHVRVGKLEVGDALSDESKCRRWVERAERGPAVHDPRSPGTVGGQPTRGAQKSAQRREAIGGWLNRRKANDAQR